MNWLLEAANRLWNGTGSQPVKTSPSHPVPVLPKILEIPLVEEYWEAYRNKKCTCVGCESQLPLSNIFRTATSFYYYPGPGFADGERIPLLIFDCPKCKERQYLAIFSNYVELGIFGGMGGMDPIIISAVNVSVTYKLQQDRTPDTAEMKECVRVPLNEHYYSGIYGKI